jgi:hypothetical protein
MFIAGGGGGPPVAGIGGGVAVVAWFCPVGIGGIWPGICPEPGGPPSGRAAPGNGVRGL